MANVNKVILVGFLCQDPEKRSTSGGNSVVNVSLATTEKWKDKQSGQMQEKTEFHRLVIWQGADAFEQYTKKGSQVYVEGSLQNREWQDKDGNKRQTTEINVRNFQFLDRAPQQQAQNQQTPPQTGNPNFPQQQQTPVQQNQPQSIQNYNAINDNQPPWSDDGPPF